MTVATRRGLLAGIGANALPTGIWRGGHNLGISQVSPGPHPDAELLELCACLRAMQAEWQRLYNATSDDDDLTTPADSAWQAFSDDVWPGVRAASRAWRDDHYNPHDLPGQLRHLRATTPEGIAAKAAAILALDDAGAWTDLRDDSYQLNRSLLEDAAGALHTAIGSDAKASA